MKNAVIVHGMPPKREYLIARTLGMKASKFHWLGWLGSQLRKNGYEVWAPEMPHPWRPEYELWKAQVEKAKIGPDTLLIGHSCGGGFWLRYLSENPKLRVGRVVLVAPWIDVPRKIAPDFFNFKFDKQLVSRTKGVSIIYSDDDMKAISLSVEQIRKELVGVNYLEFRGYGHFTIFKMHTRRFPELVAECLKREHLTS